MIVRKRIPYMTRVKHNTDSDSTTLSQTRMNKTGQTPQMRNQQEIDTYLDSPIDGCMGGYPLLAVE